MNNIKELAKTIIVIMILVAGVSLVSAWTAPTQAPPAGNVSAPVNVGSITQYKSGAFGVGGLFHAYGGISSGGGGTDLYGWGKTNGVWDTAGRHATERSYAFNHHTGLAFSAHSAYGGIRFYNQGYPNIADSTMVMAVTNNNVGIGTASPTQKLDVNGDIKTNAGIWLGGVRKIEWPSEGGTVVTSGLYGYCIENLCEVSADSYKYASICLSATAPAFCVVANSDGSTKCSCPAGYKKTLTGAKRSIGCAYTVEDGRMFYSCLKN